MFELFLEELETGLVFRNDFMARPERFELPTFWFVV
jgi:hypothetical protein